MNKLVYLKIGALLLALCGVIYVITHLSASRVSAGMEQVGLAPGAPAAAPTTAAGATGAAAGPGWVVNLCRTRVHEIAWPDGRRLVEASGGMKARWQAFNLTAEDVGSMDIEKWLSLHCEVAATPHAVAAPLKPYVTIKYIDGSSAELQRADDGVWAFTGKAFSSPALDQAFADLIKVANLEPRGP